MQIDEVRTPTNVGDTLPRVPSAHDIDLPGAEPPHRASWQKPCTNKTTTLAPPDIPTGQPPKDVPNTICCKNDALLDIRGLQYRFSGDDR